MPFNGPGLATSMRQFSLRSLLGLGLLFLVILPALAAGWVIFQRNGAAVEASASAALMRSASRAQSDVQAHLMRAHEALDGLMPQKQGSLQGTQALAWVTDPALFAPMAFALTRMSQDMRHVYFIGANGLVHGVENAGEGFRFSGRGAVDAGARSFSVHQPNDPLKPAGAEGESPDPRSQPWYAAAMRSEGRAFSAVAIYPSSRQLVLTLSQPVYDPTGIVAGVLGADLSLRPLSAQLRGLTFSPRGVAFLVDDKGFLLASSSEEALTQEKAGQVELRAPYASANPLIRASFRALEKSWSGVPDGKKSNAEKLLRLRDVDEAMFVTHTRVGASSGLNWTLVLAAPEGDFTAEPNRFNTFFLGALGAFLLLAILLTSWGAHRLEALLGYFSRAAGQLGMGNIPPLSQKTLTREFGELAQSLHTSALQLNERRFDGMSEALVFPEDTLSPDPVLEELQAELATRTTELAAARDRGMAATRSKAAFLSVISHELRTPLNGVVGMTSLLAKTPLTVEQQDYLESLTVSGRQLQTIVDEILDFSRTEGGEIELQIAPMNVRDVLTAACQQAAAAAAAKGLKLEIDIPPRVRRRDGSEVSWVIEADGARLAQVLGQIALNAVKFTESGDVTIQVRTMESRSPGQLPMLEARILDTGPGIAHDQLRNVFMAFTQIDSSLNRRHGGTGLGLATCKRLVELMGGQIGVESELGQGACFWFTVLAPWASAANSEPVVDEVDLALFSATPERVAEKLSILVVDDNAINLKVACAMLLKFGYRIMTAEGGQQAIDMVAAAISRGEVLGAVLMDVHMPDVDGIQATRAILAAHGERAPPIIALTAGSSAEDRQRCLDAGMAAYLTKPLQLSALAQSLDRWVPTEAVALARLIEPASLEPAGQAGPKSDPVPLDLPKFERFSDADVSMPAGLVDFDRLNDFKEFDDEQLTMTREVIGLLFSEVPVQLAAIERAILKGDVQGLSSAAHSLRGAASNVGAVTVQHLCSVLERGTLEAKTIPGDASGCLVALRIAWNRTRPLLENWR